MMVERLKHEGTPHSSRDLLKICVKMGASWSAQVFWVWGGFKPTVKLIQVYSKLLIHLSAGGGCLVVGDGFQTFPH